MPASPQHIDKPEPRGQTIAAVLAVGAIYLALPRNVVVGPIWLLPTVIVVLLVPTVVTFVVVTALCRPYREIIRWRVDSRHGE